MQYSKTFISISAIVVGFVLAPGCKTDPAQGGAGAGGEGQGGNGGSTATNSGGSGGGTTTSGSGSSSASSSSSGSSGGTGEPPAMNGMTAAHNMVRANVSPAPTNPIPPLTWDDTVAAFAQTYAEKCVFMHSGGPYGENIYATTGGATPQDVVSSWSSEAANYDYATNTCNGTCGHYTQVVWANSIHLGCGMAVCNKNSPFGGGSWEMWICDYDPPGNYNGQRPY